MSSYDRLVQTGAIGSYKRDVLLEAAADEWALCHIKQDLEVKLGIPSEHVVSAVVRFIQELREAGFVHVAKWKPESRGAYLILDLQADDLVQVLTHEQPDPFEPFLVATEKGCDWVRRYDELIGEL